MRNSRRIFLRCLPAAMATAYCGARPLAGQAQVSAGRGFGAQRVAAIQFAPRTADIQFNLDRAETLIKDAARLGARWIVLPEFFASGFALHPDMLDAHRPFGGPVQQWMVDLARTRGVWLGGSWLARSGTDVFNTFILATPDGNVFAHDKDFPSTALESSFFAAGEDAAFVAKLREDGAATADIVIGPRPGNDSTGLFAIPNGAVGAAMCWELTRYRTAARLRGRIDLLMASSSWPHADPLLGWPGRTREDIAVTRTLHHTQILAAPRRQARLLGAPVVHANFTGLASGFASTKFDQPATTSFFGESQIVDANGNMVAKLGTEEGVLIAEVEMQRRAPSEGLRDEFWIPEMPPRTRRNWSITGAAGRDFYIANVRPRLGAPVAG